MSSLEYGYLGPPGTFSEQAISIYCKKHGGKTKGFSSIRDIVKAVINDQVQLGLLPLENSLEGSVNLSLDLLYQHSELKLYREIILPISHYLLAQKGVTKAEIKEIYSHPQAIAQSGNYLAKEFENAKIVYTDSTAAAAKKAMEAKNRAAVGSIRLADIYDLEILENNLQGDLPNSTRFVLAAKKNKDFSGNNHLGESAASDFKTSIICAPEVNEAGILYKMLGKFAEENIDLTRIESRPSRQQLGEYIFYIDLKGCISDKNLSSALAKVEKMSSYFRLLGSYTKTVME
ncbi:Prephenate dehydratase [Halanaerobium saccharolyticum subsp. saccharolyticum DSM 6643]|uniref:Prephenate dehydratase n=1 Tax=Halanaerobium saccharolyticum subsp. saccharolyticum DSM 6643 TaxID=1293054 RepID=M5E1Y6_9FIRM|nr:prephenate dehydratase [Halanaerobium saccharolyticum]CCU79976.1 Prephenate dehydratase [Halanaerobium saccharolyticum subsp. saccharolyticum DSM 6643]